MSFGSVVMEKVALNRASKLDKSEVLSDESVAKLHALAAKEKFIRMSRQKNAKKLAKMSLNEKINSKGIAAKTGNIPKKIDLKKYKGMETSYATKPSDALGQYRRLKFNGKRNAETISVAKKTLKDLGGEFKGVKRSKREAWDNGGTRVRFGKPGISVTLSKKFGNKSYRLGDDNKPGHNFDRITRKVIRGKVAGHEIDAETKAATRFHKYIKGMGLKPGTPEYSYTAKNLAHDFRVGTHQDAGVLSDENKWLKRQGNRFVDRINDYDRRQSKLNSGGATEADLMHYMSRMKKNVHKTTIQDIANEGLLYNHGDNHPISKNMSKNLAKNKLFVPQGNKKRGGYKYHDYRYDD